MVWQMLTPPRSGYGGGPLPGRPGHGRLGGARRRLARRGGRRRQVWPTSTPPPPSLCIVVYWVPEVPRQREDRGEAVINLRKIGALVLIPRWATA